VLETGLKAGILAGETSEAFAGRVEELHCLMADGALFMTREDSCKGAKLVGIFRAAYGSGRGMHGDGSGSRNISSTWEAARSYSRSSNTTSTASERSWWWQKGHPGSGTGWSPATPGCCKYRTSTTLRGIFGRLPKGEGSRDESKRGQWAEARIWMLLQDGGDGVPEGLESMEESGSKAAEKARMSLIQHYKTHRKRVKYKPCRDQRLPVGSGPIESAPRDVLQGRPKLSGQRCAFKGWQAVANHTGPWKRETNGKGSLT
jgi:hypothetical protein